ncbi:MAG: bacteriohemerythrin [Sedimentisphaerales bacterium]|nr:bacteriohemerythrin [Sedimentisphaerales bacterium]
MEIFAWSDNYSVGVQRIDLQHKQLFAMINELHQAMASGKGNETVGKVLDGLILYTRTHFATEEKLMLEKHYPDYAAHKQAHDTFAVQATDLLAKVKSGKGMVTLPVMNMLKTWLKEHILQQDQAYSPYLSGAMAR